MALFAEADAQRAMSLDHVGVDFDGAAVLLQGLIETMAIPIDGAQVEACRYQDGPAFDDFEI